MVTGPALLQINRGPLRTAVKGPALLQINRGPALGMQLVWLCWRYTSTPTEEPLGQRLWLAWLQEMQKTLGHGRLKVQL